LFISLLIYSFQFTDVFIAITRDYIPLTHHPITTSDTKERVSSSSKYTFSIKITIVDDRKTTVGKSTFWQR
jgi:hypothetical protein